MALDTQKQNGWAIGDLLEFEEDAMDAEVLAEFKSFIGEPPYKVHAFDMNGRHIDGLIVSGSLPVRIPEHVTDLRAYFNMSKRTLDAYMKSGKPMVEGLLSLPTILFKKLDRIPFAPKERVQLALDRVEKGDAEMILDAVGIADYYTVYDVISHGPQRGWIIIGGNEPVEIPEEHPLTYYFTLTPSDIEKLAGEKADLPGGLVAVPADVLKKLH